MTAYSGPNLPAIFTEAFRGLREFDKNLITELGKWDIGLKSILDRGISFSDNIDAVSISFTSSGTPDAENTVAHTLGKVPTGFLVYDLNKGAVVYRGTTSWTATNIYLKVNTASTAVKAWVF